jgi:hypothetical protein
MGRVFGCLSMSEDIVKKSKTLNQNSKSRQQSLDMNHSVQNQTNSQILSGEITPSEQFWLRSHIH